MITNRSYSTATGDIAFAFNNGEGRNYSAPTADNFPQFTGNSTNSTGYVENDVVQFRVNLTDDTALSTFVFAHNLTGTLENGSVNTISGTSFEMLENLTMNSTFVALGSGVQWEVHFNDSAGQQNNTGIQKKNIL